MVQLGKQPRFLVYWFLIFIQLRRFKMEVLDWSLAVVAIVGGSVLGAVVLWDIICEVLG